MGHVPRHHLRWVPCHIMLAVASQYDIMTWWHAQTDFLKPLAVQSVPQLRQQSKHG